MSSLSSSERRKLEKLLGMQSGYVLNFSDRTFGQFFSDHKVEIGDARYLANGTSKANRMRTHWDLDADHKVGTVIGALIDYATDENCLPDLPPSLVDECRKLSVRLSQTQGVSELGALTPSVEDRDFEFVAQHVREAIDKNQPEGALDRLHTFVVKFVRNACEQHGIDTHRDKPLHSLFGEYVRAMRDGGYLESQMTDRILKSSISVLEAFNDVRNHKSLAHDNPILNYEESLLIFNHVAASIRFLKALDMQYQSHHRLQQPNAVKT